MNNDHIPELALKAKILSNIFAKYPNQFNDNSLSQLTETELAPILQEINAILEPFPQLGYDYLDQNKTLTILHCLFACSHLTIDQATILVRSLDFSQTTIYGETILMIALSCYNDRLVHWMIDNKKAELNNIITSIYFHPKNKTRLTALFLAVHNPDLTDSRKIIIY